MKDEEMAEEIANKRCNDIGCFGHCNFSSPKHHRCGEWHREYNCALEGLKSGRPQWHDLREDPNDLPKRNNELTDRGDVVITDKGIAHYNFRKQKWYVHCFECDMSFSENIIAWCEIPTFDKE